MYAHITERAADTFACEMKGSPVWNSPPSHTFQLSEVNIPQQAFLHQIPDGFPLPETVIMAGNK